MTIICNVVLDKGHGHASRVTSCSETCDVKRGKYIGVYTAVCSLVTMDSQTQDRGLESRASHLDHQKPPRVGYG